jgi:L-fuculose-phosphate aldolase
VWLAHEVEVLAKQYLLALQIGPPPLLSDEQMDEVLEKFKTYGRRNTEDR